MDIGPIDDLKSRLGPFGFQWLCACAVFPALRFPVTVHLGRRLAEAVGRPAPDADEHGTLFQLDWFRQGWIPRNTRLMLARSLDPALLQAVRAAIDEVLAGKVGDADTGIVINPAPIAIPHGRDRPDSRDEGDVVLASIMLGDRVPAGDWALDAALGRRLGLAFAIWRDRGFLKALLALAGGLTLAAGLAFAGLPAWLATRIETVTILEPVPPASASLTAAQAQELTDVATAWATSAVLEGHTHSVIDASFSPDGRRVVTASADETARVWDLSGPTPTATILHGHTGSVFAARFSPDGQRVVTASDDKTARVWDLSSPTPTATILQGHTYWVNAASFSPDGQQVVTASGDETARAWDLSGPTPTVTILQGHTGSVWAASFSPDGRRVVTASWDNTARVWDLSGSTPTATILQGHTDAVTAASFSPDGRRVVTASVDETARVWDLSGPTPTATILQGHSGGVLAASFSPDGQRVVTASTDGTARVWDLSGPTLTAIILQGHTDRVGTASFSPDGQRVVTASWDKTARIWDLSGPTPTATILQGHTGPVNGAAFSPDGKRVVTAFSDKTARVWSPIVTQQLSSTARQDLPASQDVADPIRRCQAEIDSVKNRDAITFEHDSLNLDESSYPILKSISLALRSCRNVIVQIEAHTDGLSTVEYSIPLSQRYADAAIRYLAEAGVDPRLMQAVGYGKTRPIATNDTPEGRSKNRRIEFVAVGIAQDRSPSSPDSLARTPLSSAPPPATTPNPEQKK